MPRGVNGCFMECQNNNNNNQICLTIVPIPSFSTKELHGKKLLQSLTWALA